jgi:glucose-1-phosphate thymidylyltransferase
MWGIIPAAGSGTRIQPLAFSKELLPVGSRHDGVVERPKAVSEYLVDRLVLGGARKVAFVISPNKADIMRYYGSRLGEADFAYVVQREPGGLVRRRLHRRPPDRAGRAGRSWPAGHHLVPRGRTSRLAG